jgi:hypothetical protein
VKGTAAVANETLETDDDGFVTITAPLTITYHDDGGVTISAPIATAEQTPTNEEN